MFKAIIEMRERFVKECGYPPEFVNLSKDQYDELKKELRECATGKCAAHAPNEIMGIELRVAA